MTKSNVIKLLDLVWNGANLATDHSWQRLNGSMRAALSLAINAGLLWSEGDFAEISSNYSFGYWCGDSTEWMYADAIESSNLSAIKSYEAWKERQPFIADDVSPSKHGSGATRQRERLAVGNRFTWKGQEVRVTSFADDQSYLTACSYKSYKPEGNKYEREKIDKRFKVTREDIIADRAERKERAELTSRLTAACQGNPTVLATVTKALKAKTNLQFAALPLEQIRKVADQYAPKPPPESLITKAHREAAKAAGACQESLRNYPIGTPLSALDREARLWVKVHLPELYEKHFAKAEAA